MVKLIYSGEAFKEAPSIEMIMQNLNYDPFGVKRWRYFYRKEAGVVHGYRHSLGEDDSYGEDDVNGEHADVTYEVVED